MTYAIALNALSNPTRRAVFERLRQRARSVGELADELPVSQPAISQHLKVLRKAGLVEVRKEGARRIYRADPRGLRELRAYVESLWDDVLAAYADSEPEEEDR